MSRGYCGQCGQPNTGRCHWCGDGPLRFTLCGAPRTKKNHGKIWRVGTRTVIKPAEAWLAWRDEMLSVWGVNGLRVEIAFPVNVRALFYRDAQRGDAVGYYQGLADVLEALGVVVDDKWIVSWDGSRLRKDAINPRVEVEVTRANPEET